MIGILLAIISLARIPLNVTAETYSHSEKTCAFNIETGKFFDLKSFPPDQRLSAYKQYIEDMKAKKYIQKPCPPDSSAPASDSKTNSTQPKDDKDEPGNSTK